MYVCMCKCVNVCVYLRKHPHTHMRMFERVCVKEYECVRGIHCARTLELPTNQKKTSIKGRKRDSAPAIFSRAKYAARLTTSMPLPALLASAVIDLPDVYVCVCISIYKLEKIYVCVCI